MSVSEHAARRADGDPAKHGDARHDLPGHGHAMVHESPPAFGGKIRQLLPYVIVVAVALWLYRVADGFGASDMPGRVGPDAWPKMALCLMIFMACVGIIKIVLGRPVSRADDAAAGREDEDLPVMNPPERYPGMVWAAVAATGAYIVAWPVLGFFLATVAYGIALMWVGRQRRLVILGTASVGFALFFLFLFMRVVYVSLPLGIEPFSQVSLGLMSLMGIH